MSSKLRSVVALVAMALLGWFCATQSKSVAETKPVAESDMPASAQQWEYQVQVVQIGTTFDKDKANILGSRGWELVTVYTQREGEFHAIYKRKKN